MTSKRLVTVAIALALCFAIRAHAGSVSIVTTPNGGGDDTQINLAGSVTNDILISSPGTTILSQQMRLVLDSGMVLDHPFGGNTPPNAALIPSFANLAFDSFVSAGSYDSGPPATPNPVPTIVARSDKLGGPGGTPALFSATEWDVLWGPALGQETTDAVDFLSARLTLSGDATATGSFDYLVAFGDETSVQMHGTVENGMIVLADTGENEPPMVDSAVIDPAYGSQMLQHTFTATDDGPLGDLTWELLSFENQDNGAAVPVNAPTFNPATQSFEWVPKFADLQGLQNSNWVATVRATDMGDPVGMGEGTLTIGLHIPEPTSLAMAGLALLGMVGFVRRRGC